MKKGNISLALVLISGLCLYNPALNAKALSNEGTLPPPKVDQASHAPISILEFRQVVLPEKALGGTTIPLEFSVVNNGSGPAKNIHIKAESQDLEALVPKSVSNVNAKYYAPKQKESYKFLFGLKEDAKAKNYAIKLSIAYVDVQTGEVHESSQMVTLSALGSLGSLGKEDLDKAGLAPDMASLAGGSSSSSSLNSLPSTPSMGTEDLGAALPVTGSSGTPSGQAPSGSNAPKIVIDSYTLDPETVNAGDPFNLTFHIFNTNRKKSVQNIRVSLSAEASEGLSLPSGGGSGNGADAAAAMAAGPSGGGSAFIPIGSSNTFHIEKIKPRHQASKELTLTTAPDTAPKTYSITVTFEYEDNNGNPYTSTEVIGVPVVQSSFIVPGDLNVEKEGQVGEEMPLSFEFFNTGKSALSNVMVKVRGNFDADTNTYYIGNLAPSSAESYDVNLVPTAKGQQRGEVVISYDDPRGRRQEFTQDFTIQVSDGASEEDQEMTQTKNKGFNWLLAIVSLPIFALIGFLVYYLVKKYKAKKSKDEDLMV